MWSYLDQHLGSFTSGAQDLCEVAGEVCILLVRADDVGGGGKGIW